MEKFGVIGYPLGHSMSAVIHRAGFKSIGINASYETLETSPESLIDRIKDLKYNGYSGFNVTIPHKVPVALFVDEVDKYADITGAINTVKINSDKSMKGYNTDVLGFKKAIPDDIDLNGKTAAVLGTGGASRASSSARSAAEKPHTFHKAVQTQAVLQASAEKNPFRTVKVGISKKELARWKKAENQTPAPANRKHKRAKPFSKFFKRKRC